MTSTSSPVRRRESNGATPIEALTLRRRPEGLDPHGADRLEQLGSDLLLVVGPAVGHQHGELVAAEAGDHLAVAQPIAQGVRDLADQLVSGAVAERVVDVLEQVDVDQHARRAAVAGDVVDVALELALERAAVEQAGERVVVGHVAQLGLVAAALRDVLRLGEEVQRGAARVAHERRRDGDPDDVAVVVQIAALAASGRDLAGEHALALLLVLRAVVGVQQRQHRAALELGRLVAGDGAQRAVDAQEAAVGAHDRHPGGALLEGGAEALLGLGEAALGLHALVDVADDRVRLGDAAGAVADDVQLRLDPDRPPVAPDEAEGRADVVGLEGAVAHREDDREVLDEHEVVAGAADQLPGS